MLHVVVFVTSSGIEIRTWRNAWMWKYQALNTLSVCRSKVSYRSSRFLTADDSWMLTSEIEMVLRSSLNCSQSLSSILDKVRLLLGTFVQASLLARIMAFSSRSFFHRTNVDLRAVCVLWQSNPNHWKIIDDRRTQNQAIIHVAHWSPQPMLSIRRHWNRWTTCLSACMMSSNPALVRWL